MSAAQADGSLAKMTANPEDDSRTATGDSYTQAIVNRDQSEQRKEDGSSGIFLVDNQKNIQSTDEKYNTNK